MIKKEKMSADDERMLAKIAYVVFSIFYFSWVCIFIVWKMEESVDWSWAWLVYPLVISFLIFLIGIVIYIFGFNPFKKKSVKEKKNVSISRGWIWIKRKSRSAKEEKIKGFKRFLFSFVLMTTSTLSYFLSLHLAGLLTFSWGAAMGIYLYIFVGIIMAFISGYVFKKGCSTLDVLEEMRKE